jgi:hypothetical protein
MTRILNGWIETNGGPGEFGHGKLELTTGERVIIAFILDKQGDITIVASGNVVRNLDTGDVEGFCDALRRALMPMVRPQG